jgi:hypothetical protein
MDVKRVSARIRDMKLLNWILIGIIVVICLAAGAYSYVRANSTPWGITRYGGKCWHEDSKPSNIVLRYRFATEESCKDFLKQHNAD